MMEEAFPNMYRAITFLARYLAPGARKHFEADQHDEISGAGDITLDEELKSRPGSQSFSPLTTKFDERPDDNESIFTLSDAHLDLMSPTHLWRGVLCVPGAAFVWLGAFASANLAGDLIAEISAGSYTFGSLASSVTFLPVFAGLTWFFWRTFVSFDWFHYRANPIRFDREKRQIHVWRSKRAGGPYSVPWNDELMFMRRRSDKDGNTDYTTLFLPIDPATGRIKRRISVGKPIRDRKKGEAFYEYIRRFMEEGRSAVPEPRYRAQMTPSLAYSFNAWFNFTGIAEQRRKGEWGVLGWLLVLGLSPLLTLLSLSHFIAMLTSRTPRWPVEMS